MSFPDDTYKWALFKLTNAIQTAGVARFGVKFHTADASGSFINFTDNGRTESVDFQCNILLPSVLNDGTPYWYDVNGDYESENTRATGDDYDGVTGLGIFDSKIVEANSTTFVVTPPVPNSNQVVSDIWIRVGLRKNAAIRFTNIELVTV